MNLIEYSFKNGFYYLYLVLKSKWYWLLGLVLFVALIYEENRAIEDDFIEEMRDLI
jgi:hypothetical protein